MPKIKVTKKRKAGKRSGSMVGLQGQELKTPDGGGNYTSPVRFRSCTDLKGRYEQTKLKRGSMSSWQNIVKQYERFPYKDEQGNIKSNFGQLRYKVDQALTTFVDFATEREQWAKITTFEGVEDGKAKAWSEYISAGFQKFCIQAWRKSSWEIMMSAKEMLLYTNGILAWPNEEGALYPQSKETVTVWPDSMAGQFPEDWDILFIEDSFPATELFEKIEDPEVAKAHGWNRGAVLRLLGSSNSTFDDDSPERIFDRFRLGEMSADAQDHVISVVNAFVKEYRKEGDHRITEMVFTTSTVPQRQSGGTVEERSTGDEYLMFSDHSIERMGHRVAVLNQTPSRKYYESTSFAQLIYTTSKQYDILMNRILDAVEDNMRVFLRTDSPDQLDKIQTMRVGMFQGLEPGMKIEQDRIVRPVKDASDVLRVVMIDQNVGTGQYQVGEQGQKGGSKTATQSEIDLAESTKISSAHMKMFNLFMTYVMDEIYRRFVTTLKPNHEHYENYRRFVRYLESNGVPKKAWSYGNVTIESVISLGAGSPAAKLQGGKIILEALASPARTPGERRAKRDIVSAVVGVENIDAYIPKDEEINVPEDSLIGIESEVLLDPLANPANTPVNADHLHMRHIPKHIAAMEAAMGIAEGIFQNREGLNQTDEGIILKTIQDILIGVDNIGAHTVAHAQLASRSANAVTKQQLQAMNQALQQVNARQDKLEQIVGQIQEKRLEESAPSGEDAELEHKKAMNAQDLEHKANMDALEINSTRAKADEGEQQSRAKRDAQARDAQLKLRSDSMKAASDIRINEQKAASAARQNNGGS